MLSSDCSRCFGLCCVATAFARSSDFAIDKRAGQACSNLKADFHCGIHGDLVRRGFPGCVAFDCLGAGQKVAQVTFKGQSWVQEPASAPLMFEVFGIVRQLHQLLYYLDAGLALVGDDPLQVELRAAFARIDEITRLEPHALAGLDIGQYREEINVLLTSTSELVRASSAGSKLNRRGADLIGADLRRVDLRGANLRGALLLRADLRRVDLSLADLTGADLRGANLCGADLSKSIFVMASQLAAARGDSSTQVPPQLGRPALWRSFCKV